MPLFRVKAANIFEGYKSSSNFHFRDRLKHPKFWFKQPKRNTIHFVLYQWLVNTLKMQRETDGKSLIVKCR